MFYLLGGFCLVLTGRLLGLCALVHEGDHIRAAVVVWKEAENDEAYHAWRRCV
jgi:hypothetical protein